MARLSTYWQGAIVELNVDVTKYAQVLQDPDIKVLAADISWNLLYGWYTKRNINRTIEAASKWRNGEPLSRRDIRTIFELIVGIAYFAGRGVELARYKSDMAFDAMENSKDAKGSDPTPTPTAEEMAEAEAYLRQHGML
jgi:hypothetical protein